jgi:recombination protein U
MATWNSRGLRGSFLEEMINMTNEKYREQGLALIQKVPTPIKPIQIDKETRHITLAYFEQKSTVDYIGVVQGIPVCFDAKECASARFPLANVHEHQIQFMSEFERQDGIAFLLIYFKQEDRYMYLPFAKLDEFWKRMQDGGPKHFKLGELDSSLEISPYSGTFVHYLEQIQMDLDRRAL